MTTYTLTELDESAFSTAMDKCREAFHIKVEANNPDLLNFEKHGVIALQAIGVVGIDLIRSADEFSLVEIADTPKNILSKLEKPESAWEQGSQQAVHKNLLEFIEANDSLQTAVKKYMAWHEEEYTTMLYSNEIGGHDALFDHITDSKFVFDEYGEPI